MRCERPEPRDAIDILFECPHTLKGIGLELASGNRPRRLKKASILAVSRRPEPPDLVRIQTNGRVTLKAVEPEALRGGMT
jgi:hypothetical protein